VLEEKVQMVRLFCFYASNEWRGNNIYSCAFSSRNFVLLKIE